MTWLPITTDDEIEQLMSHFNDFHDSYLRELHFQAPGSPDGPVLGVSEIDQPILRLFFQVIVGEFKAIELVAVGRVRLNLAESGVWWPTEHIDAASIRIVDHRTFWTVTDRPGLPLAEDFWFSCDCLYWRPVDEWKGNALRYLNPELEIVQEVDLLHRVDGFESPDSQ